LPGTDEGFDAGILGLPPTNWDEPTNVVVPTKAGTHCESKGFALPQE